MNLKLLIIFSLFLRSMAFADTTLQVMCNEYNNSFVHFFVDGPMNVTAMRKVGNVESISKDADSFRSQFAKDCLVYANSKPDTIEEASKLNNKMMEVFSDRCMKTYKDAQYFDACEATANTYYNVLDSVAKAHKQGKSEGELAGFNKCESTLTAQSNSTLPKIQRTQIQSILDGVKTTLGSASIAK